MPRNSRRIFGKTISVDSTDPFSIRPKSSETRFTFQLETRTFSHSRGPSCLMSTFGTHRSRGSTRHLHVHVPTDDHAVADDLESTLSRPIMLKPSDQHIVGGFQERHECGRYIIQRRPLCVQSAVSRASTAHGGSCRRPGYETFSKGGAGHQGMIIAVRSI
jgi:hypothetical protein